MQFIPQDTSPFLILWYLFLGFFAVVIAVNFICLIIAGVIDHRTNKLIKDHEVSGLKIKRTVRKL